MTPPTEATPKEAAEIISQHAACKREHDTSSGGVNECYRLKVVPGKDNKKGGKILCFAKETRW